MVHFIVGAQGSFGVPADKLLRGTCEVGNGELVCCAEAEQRVEDWG